MLTNTTRSGAIQVGKSLNEAKLNESLKKGTYDCIAYFNALDDLGESIVLNVEPMILVVAVLSSLTLDVDVRGIVDYTTDFSSVSVGSKKIGFNLNEVETKNDGRYSTNKQYKRWGKV